MKSPMPSPFIQTAGPDTGTGAEGPAPPWAAGTVVGLTAPPGASLVPCLGQCHLPRTTPCGIPAKPSQLATPISESLPRVRLQGKNTHMEFSRMQSASSGTDSLRHCWPALLPCERKKGPRRAPGRGVTLRLNKGHREQSGVTPEVRATQRACRTRSLSPDPTAALHARAPCKAQGRLESMGVHSVHF